MFSQFLVAEEELVEARKARHQETDVHLGLLLKQQHGTQFLDVAHDQALERANVCVYVCPPAPVCSICLCHPC